MSKKGANAPLLGEEDAANAIRAGVPVTMNADQEVSGLGRARAPLGRTSALFTLQTLLFAGRVRREARVQTSRGPANADASEAVRERLGEGREHPQLLLSACGRLAASPAPSRPRFQFLCPNTELDLRACRAWEARWPACGPPGMGACCTLPK